MPLSRVRQAVAAAGLFAAALASGLTLDGAFGDIALDGTAVYDLVEPGTFGLDLPVAPELPESATLAVLAVAMVGGAFARNRKNVSP